MLTVRFELRGTPLQPVDEFFSREHRYSLGVDSETGRHYLSIPVTVGAFDYEEYYALDDGHYARLLESPLDAANFADECRRREHDDLLIIKPGTNRGVGS